MNFRLVGLINVLAPGLREGADAVLASLLLHRVEKGIDKLSDEVYQTLIFVACHDGLGMLSSVEERANVKEPQCGFRDQMCDLDMLQRILIR